MGLENSGVIARELPDTYRILAVPRDPERSLRAAMMRAGDEAAAAGLSAGWCYGARRSRRLRA
jgi:hypothetical protein